MSKGKTASRRVPNQARVGDGLRQCYACERVLDEAAFKSTEPNVCVRCRSTRAYQEPLVLRHFMRWCQGCETYEPLTVFWKEGGSLSTSCSLHQKERKRKRRLSYLGADGYRKRWMHELKTKLACSHCGSTSHLTFLHLNPAEKAFTLSGAENNKTIEQIKAELRKCEVLCRDCMTDVVHSQMYKQGMVRSEPIVRWEAIFREVDAVVEPLGRPKRTTQLELF